MSHLKFLGLFRKRKLEIRMVLTEVCRGFFLSSMNEVHYLICVINPFDNLNIGDFCEIQ